MFLIMAQKKDFLSKRKAVNFLDLFAGAGGFSEGFMQAYTDDKYYDFILASDHCCPEKFYHKVGCSTEPASGTLTGVVG